MLPFGVYSRTTNQVARLLNSITEPIHALLGQSIYFAKYLFGIILHIVLGLIGFKKYEIMKCLGCTGLEVSLGLIMKVQTKILLKLQRETLLYARLLS